MDLPAHRHECVRIRHRRMARRARIIRLTSRVTPLVLALFAWTTASRAGDNLAMGRPYKLTPPPNYKACTDKGDSVQLTDGVRRDSNWMQISTVGWKDQSQPTSIRIDLGSVEPIDEVRISTVGGGHAGVFFPALVLIMVSDDGAAFHVAKVVDRPMAGRSEPERPRRLPHVIVLRDLGTRGRFVLVTLLADQRYLFLDEIEVMRGTHDAASVRFQSTNTFQAEQVQVILAAVRRHRYLVEDINKFQSISIKDAVEAGWRKRFDDLRESAETAPAFSPPAIDDLSRRLGVARGEWLAGRSDRTIFWRSGNPMIQHRSSDVFVDSARKNDLLLIEGWANEFESAALNITNASPVDAQIAVAVSPLRTRDGEIVPWDGRLVLRHAVYVESTRAGVVGDALVRLSNDRISIAAGSAAQLWMTIQIPDIKPGDYDFALRLDRIGDGSSDPETTAIPGRLVINEPRFPEEISLNSCNWAYLGRLGLTGDSLRKVQQDLQSHYANIYVIPGSELPKGTLRGDGSVSISFARFDRAMARYPDARRYLLWWGYAAGRVSRHQFGSFMSAEWKAAMRQYLALWVDHLREMGVGYDRFAMYPFDESLCDEFLELARFIKDVDPRIAIFANSIGGGDLAHVDRFAPLVDIWCLPEAMPKSSAVRRHLRETTNAEIWRYNTGREAKSRSPYGYYRLQPWRAWSAGDTGSAFWIYATGRQKQTCNGWDDFTCSRGRWSVVYDGTDAPVDALGEPFIPSRRWEAWREGVEDYEYLHTLDSLIKLARKRPLSPEWLKKAESVLAGVVVDVLAHVNDPDTVYEARRRLTVEIEALRKLLEKSGAAP